MENEIPAICNEYDALSEQISSLEDEISALKENILSKTALVKEYLQILEDAKEVGLHPPLYHFKVEDDGSQSINVVNGSVDYFQKKIKELDGELLSDDALIKESEKKLSEMKKELEELTVKIKDAGYSKLCFPLSRCVWYPKNEAEKYIKNPFVTWIV